MEPHRPPESPISLDRSEVFRGVTTAVAEQMGIAPEKIRESDALVEDIGCDSLDIVEISMLLEEQFDISIPDEFGDKVGTVGQVTDGVLRLLGGKTSS